jgi:hypothetical protein
VSIRVDGEQEVQAAIKALIKSVSPSKIEPVLLSAARMQTKEAKALAPVRRSQGGAKKQPPGQLKKGVRTKQLERLFGKPAPAISAVDWKVAPHAYLVHEGTGERVGGRRSRRYKGKKFGNMPANPFFSKAWGNTRNAVMAFIESTVAALIGGAVK